MTKIYKATNTINGKAYIGITTKSIRIRKRQHEKGITKNDSLFTTAIKSFGPENFTWEILEYHIRPETAAKREQELIQEHETHISENGYNVSLYENIPPTNSRKNTRNMLKELESLLTLYNDGDF